MYCYAGALFKKLGIQPLLDIHRNRCSIDFQIVQLVQNAESAVQQRSLR